MDSPVILNKKNLLIENMGKQVRFFMTSEDESNFLRAIHDIAPFRLIHNIFPNEAKMYVDPHRLNKIGKETNLSLVNQALDRSVKYDFYPSQSSFSVDLIESEVVQFHRCRLGTWLKDGRLWFDEKTVESESKSVEFVKWGNSLLKWVRTNYEKSESWGCFVGPDALALAESGKLQLGPPLKKTLSTAELRKLLGPSATKKRPL